MKVRAIDTCVVGLDDGTTVNVAMNESFDRNAAVVKQHPWLFERDNSEGEARTTRRG